MYLRPAATDIPRVDACNAHVLFGRSVVVMESTQSTENIIGYIALAIVVGLLLVGFAGVFLVRRCCAYVRKTRQNWKRRRARRRIASSSSSIAPKEKTQISTTTVLRSENAEKTTETAPSSPTDQVFSDPPPYISSNPKVNQHIAYDNGGGNSPGTVSSIIRSPSPVHVNAFNHPRQTSTLRMRGDGMEESISAGSIVTTGITSPILPPSVTFSIRPHGIPLTPLPEDASAVFPTSYFEADEQTLYGTTGSESDHFLFSI